MSTLTWSSSSHNHKEDKSPDWFWALGLVAVSIAIAAVLLGNSLFSILILLAAIVLGLSVNVQPRDNTYIINTRGVTINDVLHPYKNIESFWIDDVSRPEHCILLLDEQKPLLPHIVINIPNNIDKDALQDYLLDYLPETELYEPTSQRIAELFGF